MQRRTSTVEKYYVSHFVLAVATWLALVIFAYCSEVLKLYFRVIVYSSLKNDQITNIQGQRYLDTSIKMQ